MRKMTAAAEPDRPAATHFEHTHNHAGNEELILLAVCVWLLSVGLLLALWHLGILYAFVP